MVDKTIESEIAHVLEGVVLSVRPLPMVPEVRLLLIQEDYPEQNLDAENYARLMRSPPYWAFCWGGGQALARWILDHPDVARDRSVVDFGAGSGVAGIAAALAGAKAVFSVDVDGDALKACQVNAELNGARVCAQKSISSTFNGLLLAADVCYEEEGYTDIVQYLEAGGDVLIAESRLRNLSNRFPKLVLIGEVMVRTFPDLNESTEFDFVRIYSSLKM